MEVAVRKFSSHFRQGALGEALSKPRREIVDFGDLSNPGIRLTGRCQLARFGMRIGRVPSSRFVTYDAQISRRNFSYPSTDLGVGVHSVVRIEFEVSSTEEVSYGNSGASR